MSTAADDEASIERGGRSLSSIFRPPGLNLQKCKRCENTVYHSERFGPVHDAVFHKTCFSCFICGQFLNLKNYWSNQVDANDQEIYCQTHVPRIGGARIDDQSVDIKRAVRAQSEFRYPSSKTHERRLPDNVPGPQVDSQSMQIKSALTVPSSNYSQDPTSHQVHGINVDALHIRGALDAQLLQRKYQRKLDKHHFPPHIAKKREQLFNAQKELEERLRKEEDEMFKTFQNTRKHEKAKLSQEINKEWEIKLKELTDKYEKSFTAKKKKETDKKMMTVQFENEKKDLEQTMTLKRERKKKSMTVRLRQKEQSATSELVTKQSREMLRLLAIKQQELKRELERELEKELQIQKNKDKSNGQHVIEPKENGTNEPETVKMVELLEVLQAPAVVQPPSPHPPSCRKKDLYRDASIFSDIDDQVIKVAENEQLTYTDLVRQLTENLVTDLEKARAIYRWITVKDLNVIEFDDDIDEDTPMGLLRGIKYGTETYHVLFMRLCSYCGLHCLEIKGHSKSVGYEPGMKITDDTFQNTWNSVLIDGDWRLIQCNWGARHLVLNKDKEKDKPKKRDQIRYQYDEHYFLTDPDEFIQEFWPLEKSWQLLEIPITRDEFEALPFVRSVFFHYGMHFDQSRLSVLQTDDKGGVKISIKIPERLENDLVFFYQLRFADKDRKHEMSYKGASLERFVFQTMVENMVTFSIHVPMASDYFFEIFANKIDESNRCLEESNANFAPFRLKCACKFKITCSSLIGKMHPLPNCAAGEWGPKKAFRHFGLSAIPQEVVPGETNDNVDTAKAGILTVDEKFELKFNIPRPLQFVAKLRMTQVEDHVLDPFVHLSADSRVLKIAVNLPQPGQYGLDLFARPKGGSDTNTLSHACKYLINCGKVSEPVDIPKINVSRNKWGPTASFEEFGLRMVSHKDPVIKINDSNQCTVELNVPENVILSFQFLREPNEDNKDYVTMVRDAHSYKTVKFLVNLTKHGNYMLSLYARKDKSEDKASPNVYNYIIQYAPMETNGNISSGKSDKHSIFRKGLFSRKDKDKQVDKNWDKYSDKSSDKSSDSR
ncbi:hillarin-like isoform X2 [Gigantopelta aegis]|uniref:hillarin-like isoform X2 n=1 Tax=Gigantopelta aegis TaxID=1735272 RepID=UPI001B88BF87|nr:hillarin-like isoform X2 [Gigantopelta aegis]